jgi:CheY-like chemotaxis protein
VFCPDSSLTVINMTEFDRWLGLDSGRDCDIMLFTASFGSSPEDPQARGLELLRRLRVKPVFPAVIALAEDGNELTAVRALQLGAVDYLPKRLLTPDRLNTSVRLALRRIEKRVQRKLASLAHVTDVSPPPDDETTREQPKPNGAGFSQSVVGLVLPQIAAATVDPMPAHSASTDAPPVAEGPESAAQAPAKSADSPADDEKASSFEFSAEATLTPAAMLDVNELIAQLKRGDESAPPGADATAREALESTAARDSASTPMSAPAPAELLTPHRPDTNNAATLAPEAASDGATQLMSPRSIAAALDAAAASAMAAGIKATESSIFGTTAVGETSTKKSGKSGSSNRPSTPSPAVTAEFIPGYVIKMKIGESEKAVVYLATSISLGSNVALKVSKTLRDDTAGRQFLEREYTAIIAIRDPLVVQIYDYGVHAGFEYLAMEYLLRGDLKARMQAGLKEAEALRYVEQIASALRVVHNAGLLHRDLKPPNVMLRENDDVALIDFGLARALDGSTPSTRTGVLRGSPYYMSPEQAQGEILDVRSDFYSLGIMLYEMLTGRKPYTGATAMEVLQQHVNSPLPPLPHSLSRYGDFIHKLVAKNRTERFGQAEEIIAAIGELRTAMTLNVESAVA